MYFSINNVIKLKVFIGQGGSLLLVALEPSQKICSHSHLGKLRGCEAQRFSPQQHVEHFSPVFCH